MSNFTRLFYHFIWTTKNREFLITAEIEKALLDYIPKKIKQINSICHEIGMIQDHIHLAVSVPPNISLSNFIKIIKGSSSHLINNFLPNQYFNWQSGYAVLSFNENLLPIVKKYITSQKQHHQDNTVISFFETIDESSNNEEINCLARE